MCNTFIIICAAASGGMEIKMTKQKHLDFLKYNYDVNLMMIVKGAHKGNQELKDEEEYIYNRRFMKELGYKTDSVGWMDAWNLSKKAFEEMIAKASEEKVKLRIYVDVKVRDDDSIEWYRLRNLPFLDEGGDEKKIPGTEICIGTIQGYKLNENMYHDFECYLVNRQVLSVFEKLNVKGYKKKWAIDTGRFWAEPYDWLYVEDSILEYFGSRVADELIKRKDKSVLEFLRPFFPEILEPMFAHAPMVTVPEWVIVPYIIKRSLLQNRDIVRIESGCLVKRTLKEALVQQKVLSEKCFEPVLLCADDEEFIVSCQIPETKEKEFWEELKIEESAEVEAYRQKQYEIFISQERPKKMITEAMALTAFRKEKREYPEYFEKGTRKAALLERGLPELVPIYKISNGCRIGEDCRIFSIEEREAAQREFDEEYQKEQLTDCVDNARVIGSACNGEWLLLLPDGKVVQYTMGEYSFSRMWDSLWEFIEEN